MAESQEPDLTTLTVQLLSAYVSNNMVPSTELASLIQTTRKALSEQNEPDPAPPEAYSRAVTVRKSLGSKDHILSMIDGRPYKTLKRHLSTHGLSPAEYRERYKLPKDYPMVAPSYSEQRRTVAAALGLGRRKTASAPDAVTAAEAAPAPVAPAAVLDEKPTEAASAKAAPKPRATSKTKAAPKAKAEPIAKAEPKARRAAQASPAPAVVDEAAPSVPAGRGRKVKKPVAEAVAPAPEATPARKRAAKVPEPAAATAAPTRRRTLKVKTVTD